LRKKQGYYSEKMVQYFMAYSVHRGAI